jgi:hypothetical protein
MQVFDDVGRTANITESCFDALAVCHAAIQGRRHQDNIAGQRTIGDKLFVMAVFNSRWNITQECNMQY